jgi:hypothetical protein
LKFRGSWGQNGSVAPLSGYIYSTDMTSYNQYPFGTSGSYNYVYGARPSSMGNDELEWETSEQWNVGIDARFLKNRLTFNVDYYEKETKGLLVRGVTPSLIVGGTASPLNAGNVSNKGFEFELAWKDRIGDFNYNIRGNLSTLENKVTYLHPSLTRINGMSFQNVPISAFEVGKPVWYFYGYEFSHIDLNTGEAVMKNVDGNKDEDGHDIINENDKTNIGCAIPTITYGITLTAEYKGIDLTVFGTGAGGNDIFMALQRPDKLNSNRMKETFYDGRWMEGADNTRATKPAANTKIDEYVYSSAMIYDGSFFKIKQIQLGYTFPKKWLNKIFVNNARIYCSLDDYFTFTKYPGFDPEASAGTGAAQGIDKGSYPTSKKIVAGINITF